MKRIILFFFGKRIRKIFIRHSLSIRIGYNEFIASPISEWRDRLWLIRNGAGRYSDKDALKFLKEGRF